MKLKADEDLYERILRGMRKGVAKALKEHKKAGRSITIWRNGRVVKIPPEKIVIREEV